MVYAKSLVDFIQVIHLVVVFQYVAQVRATGRDQAVIAFIERQASECQGRIGNVKHVGVGRATTP